MKHRYRPDCLGIFWLSSLPQATGPAGRPWGGSVPLSVRRSCSRDTRGHPQRPGPGASAQRLRAPGRRSRSAERRETAKSLSLWTGPLVSLNLAHEAGRGPGLLRGSSGKRAPTGPVSAAGPSQGPASLRLLPGAPRLGAGACPARCPPPTRLSPAAPRALREEPPAAVTRQGGNAGARRPCGERGSARALGSAPAAPGGSPVEPGRCGAAGTPAGGRASGSARVRAAAGAPGWGRGAGRGALRPLLRANAPFPGAPAAPHPQPDSESFCSLFPPREAVSAFCFLNSRVASVDGHSSLTRAQLRRAGRREPGAGQPPTRGGKRLRVTCGDRGQRGPAAWAVREPLTCCPRTCRLTLECVAALVRSLGFEPSPPLFKRNLALSIPTVFALVCAT